MKKHLNKLNLNPENCVIIGSGILQALGIRNSNDIDAVVKQDTYDSLKKSGKFTVEEYHVRETLEGGLFEIGTDWNVLGKKYCYDDLLKVSEIIDGVRYNKLEFLLKCKKSWVENKTSRPKDMKDIELIEEYFRQRRI